MAIYVKENNKITDIFANINGIKKRIKSAWVNKNGVPTKVFGTVNIDDSYEIAPTEAYSNWNYTLDDTNDIITLNYYTGSETDVIVYANYEINGKKYRTQLASNVENAQSNTPYMFNRYANEQCRYIKTIMFSKKIDTSNVTNMSSMFSGCSLLRYLDLSSFDTSNVTNMSMMFYGCSIGTLDLSGFDTSNVTDMSFMFYGCGSLTSLDLSEFDTSNVTKMTNMFANCRMLTTLDLSSFDTSNVTNMRAMFNACTALKIIYVTKDKWLTSQANTENMFYICGTSSVTYI